MEMRGTGVVVTGASRGLGKALARELAAAGAKVLLVARGREELDTAVAEVRRDGGEAWGFAADVGTKDAVYAIAGAAAELVGPVALVVHNASTLVGRDAPEAPAAPGPMPLLLDTECEELERVLAVNLVGTFRISKALLGPMLLRGSGLVVHLSSDAAVAAYPAWGAYGVSKAALDHMARIWAAELEGTGVRFLSIDPGEMDTRMHAEAMPDADRTVLAAPADVARRIAALLRHVEDFPSGARIEVPLAAVES